MCGAVAEVETKRKRERTAAKLCKMFATNPSIVGTKAGTLDPTNVKSVLAAANSYLNFVPAPNAKPSDQAEKILKYYNQLLTDGEQDNTELNGGAATLPGISRK